ncbi:Tol-Pal system protein TolB [Anaerolineae bacterium]|nr:Tol-Pal system protein TolB [Anaerolineae bacterium]
MIYNVSHLRSFSFSFAVLILLAFSQSVPTQTFAAALTPTGRLIVTAEAGGAWNIFTADLSGSAWQKIAVNVAPAREPAMSPDGKTIAFRSKREGNWEIYALRGDTVTRLTRGTIYSGAPVWSPDSKKIAFESYARGDLDVWVMNSDGSAPIDLTDNEKTYDYAPAWSPDGKWIAFTSWRTGIQQIFVVAADCVRACKATNLSASKSNDQQAAWSPDGSKLAFVSDRDGQRAIYIADFTSAGLTNTRRITFSGWDEQPAWSPDGKWIAFISPRPTRQPIYIVAADGSSSIPHIVENGPAWASSVEWSEDATALGNVGTVTIAGDDASNNGALYREQPDLAPADSGHPYDLRRIRSAKLEGGFSRLSGRIADSFEALLVRTKQEVGYDFLALLADMTRSIDVKCDVTCDTLSWHKAGRAVDTRTDYNGMEIVREDQLGETYWRTYLKASAQNGTLGEPLKDAPWDLSYRARWVVAPGEGGVKKPVPYGFYVDFTGLARQYSWERISSYDSEDFDWKTNKIGAEYWHIERRQGMNWYQAMREVYAESDLKSLTDWNTLIKSGYDPYLLYLKGIPAPASAWRWYALNP